MKAIAFSLIVFLSLCVSSVYAQRPAGETRSGEVSKEQLKLEPYEKPLRELVAWMTENLQLTESQEKELLDFYLSTPVYFPSVANSETDAIKQESMAKQEQTLKQVLTPEQLELFLSRKEEAFQVLMKHMPK